MHVMLDIETLGTEPNAAVLAIGYAWLKDLDSPMNSGWVPVPLQPQLDAGAVIDLDTLVWWHKVDADLFTTLLLKAASTTELKLPAIFPLTGTATVWCKGASFDFPILRQLFKRFGLPLPWNFRRECCYRTLRTLSMDPPYESNQHKHHPEADAVAQLEALVRLLQEWN